MKIQTSRALIARLVLLVACSLALASFASAAGANVSATLHPSRITLDDAAQLTVTVQGRHAVEPQLPDVDGLEFTPVGQSSSFQFINGAVSSSVSHVYQVTATRVGTFAIPSIRAGSAGSKPLELQVVKGAGGPSRGAQSLGRALPPPNVNWSSAPTAAESANGQPAFLRVVTPKQELFVGELVPVRIKAYFRSGMSASLNGLPTLSSDAFTLSKLSREPEQSPEIVDGMPFTVVTWPATLTPVKAGDYALNLELPVLVRVQERPASRGRNPSGPMFDDSFFNDSFGRVTEKPITLKTDLAMMNVLPLPVTGRPPDFSGAVGQFDVMSAATPAKVTAGEPLTMKLTVSGTGNFDRVASAGLTDSAAFKTYKPSSRFEPADSVGLQGSKTFEQAIVPRQSGQVEVPAIAFSYFDPEARKYVTQRTQPIAVTVAPGSGNPANIAAASPHTPSVASAAPASSTGGGWFPNAVEPGRFVSSLQPVLVRPWFIAVLAAPLILLGCGLWYLKRRERLAADPDHAREVARTAALREWLEGMDSAVKTGATRAFFVCARRALQEHLAQVWKLPPSAVTLAEINARLKDAGADVRAIFQAADQTAYAGQTLSPGDLHGWRQRVHHQIKQMESL